MTAHIQPFGAWLELQMDHVLPDVRRCAWRAASRRAALHAMHQRYGEWPTFVDYVLALGMGGEPELQHALGLAWGEWRRTGNVSRVSENGGGAS